MRIETLYEFLLLTTNLNFTETAKSFYISQSVLSNHVSSLEKSRASGCSCATAIRCG